MPFDPADIIRTLNKSKQQRAERGLMIRPTTEVAKMSDEDWRHEVAKQTDESIEVNMPWLKMRGNGILGVIMMITAMLIGSIFYIGWQMQEEHRTITNSQAAIVSELKDIFLAVMLPPEVKENLPPALKDKIKEKAEDKAVRKIEKLEREGQ